MTDCPICYEPMVEVLNVCVTACNHTFHTSCLMRSGNVCPMCRTSVCASKTTPDKMPAGVYSASEYRQWMQQNNISMDELSLTATRWLEECKEHEDMMRELEEMKKKREEKRKNDLKKTDMNKYKLFYH